MEKRFLFTEIYPLILVTVLALCSACQWTPPGEPKGRLIAILSHWGWESQGYELIDLSGRRSNISKNLGVTWMPLSPAVWSPSGGRLAYQCSFTGDERSWICDIDVATMTMQKYVLPEDGYSDDLTWSADGMSFLFVWGRDYPEPSEIRRLDRTSLEMSVLSVLPVGVRIQDWSPDRSQIAFVASDTRLMEPDGVRMETGDLYIQDVHGSPRLLLGRDVDEAKWSPDGDTIAYSTGLKPTVTQQLCWTPVVDGETNCVKEMVADLAWAPEGERLAFSGGRGIRVVNTRTEVVETLVDLTNDDEGAFDLDWSPDGKYLAFSKCYSKIANQGCEIHVVSNDGEELRRLTRNRFADEFPVWQPIIPDGDRLIRKG
jgi:Tol biopolymer transport system component